jgi:hypothetical protein
MPHDHRNTWASVTITWLDIMARLPEMKSSRLCVLQTVFQEDPLYVDKGAGGPDSGLEYTTNLELRHKITDRFTFGGSRSCKTTT